MLVEFPTENRDKEEAFTVKLFRYRFPIFAGLVLFLLLIGVVTRFGMKERNQIEDFFQIGSHLNELRKGEEINHNELEALIEKHPEISPLLDHYLIESFFLSGEADKGREIGENSLRRISYINPLYQEFVKTSFMIEEGDLKEALDRSIDLEKKISNDPSLARLKFFNLFRIGSLENSLGLDAKSSWKRVSQYLSPENGALDPSIRSEIIAHLNESGVSYEDIIQAFQEKI